MFDHIYIESSIQSHPITREILSHFPNATQVAIDNYKQVFNRPNQNFFIQRNNQKLILAKQETQFLHMGDDRVRSFGDPHIVSCSMVRNCMYHCEYCFLSGMHESSHIVIYVNIEDFEHAVKEFAQKVSPDPVYLIGSYLSDLPSFEQFFPISEKWIHIIEEIPNVDLEIRTKSDGYSFLRRIGPRSHTVLTFSLSPQEIVQKYEHGTASLQTRILQTYQATRDGWRVRLCFDPIIYSDHWKKIYKDCVEQTFARCDPLNIEKISYGVFRMSSTHLQRMKRIRPGSGVLQRDIVSEQGLSTYPKEVIEEIREEFKLILRPYFSDEKIFFVHG